MKTYANVDSQGKIRSFIFLASDKAEVKLEQRPDIVTVPIKDFVIKDTNDIEALRKLARRHKVEVTKPTGKIKEKSA